MLRALAALAIALLWAPAAVADVAIAPAADGHVGAWLVAGTLPEVRCAAIDAATLSPAKGARLEATSFRLASTPSGALDLVRVLGAGKTQGPCAIAGAILEVEARLDGWLLISADGPTDVWVGGRELWREPRKRLRDGAWDALPLKLERGRHALVVRLRHPGEHWALAARVLDASLEPPLGFRWSLPGADEADASALARNLLTVAIAPGLDATGYTPRLTLAFDNGVPRGVPLPASLELSRGADRLARLELGTIAVGARAVHGFEAQLPRLTDRALGTVAQPVRLQARVRVGPARTERSFVASRAAAPALANAEAARALLATKRARFLDAKAVDATLVWWSERLRRAASDLRLTRRIARLEALGADVRAGKDPFVRAGLVNIARWSELDGEPEPLTLHIPASYGKDGARRYPLVVALHGYNGSPSSVLRAFLDVDPGDRGPKLDGFVLAPNAYGNAFYRGPGEHEVLGAIDWVLARYPIDADRVSITGVSMGGTGSAFVALRHAQRFSAASPLCGYHSYFVRRDTSKRPVRAWESDRMHHWSPASWAENGKNLPLHVAHGTKDFPLENSRVLIERYRELKYTLSDEWPEIGHSVWEKTWDGARMWPWLSSKRRDPEPARVTLRTDSLRTAESAWLRITRLARPGGMGTLEATIVDPTKLSVSARDVAAFAIERVSKLAKDRAVSVEIDGLSHTFAAGEHIALRLEAGKWHKGSIQPKPGEKRAGVEGPIRDVFEEPLVFVWGSGDPRTARANREVAEAFARTRHGPGIHYRVISDVELDAATEKSHALFVVGTAADHRLLAQSGGSLPIRAQAGSLRVGDRRLEGPGLGAIFVHPNPRHPEQSVVIVTGVDAAGIWRALSLPQLLPDFVVYDSGLSPASAEQILGAARVRFGGFFDHGWRLPADPKDPGGGTRAP